MIIKDLCVQPENELDELFIESEIKFLIDISIHKQKEFKDITKYSDIIQQHYTKWVIDSKRDTINHVEKDEEECIKHSYRKDTINTIDGVLELYVCDNCGHKEVKSYRN